MGGGGGGVNVGHSLSTPSHFMLATGLEYAIKRRIYRRPGQQKNTLSECGTQQDRIIGYGGSLWALAEICEFH